MRFEKKQQKWNIVKFVWIWLVDKFLMIVTGTGLVERAIQGYKFQRACKFPAKISVQFPYFSTFLTRF